MRWLAPRWRGTEARVRRPEAAGVGRDLVLVGVWFGLLAGVGEGAYVLLKGRLLLEPVARYPEASSAVIWTAPLALALTLAGLALVLAGLARVWPRLPSVRLGIGLFAGVGVLTWVMVPARAGTIPACLLALGVGLQATRLAGPRLPEFVGYVRRSVPRGLALVGVLALIQQGVVPQIARLRLARAAPAAAGTNVIFVVLDTQRSDRIGLYGYERPTTPELDRFARSAITFDQAWSPSGWTFPTHASLFTGEMFAGEHLGAGFRNPLDERHTTLAEVLRDGGYNTAAFAANMLYANSQLGLAQGFLKWSGLRVTPRTAFLSTWLNRSSAMTFARLRNQPEELFERDAADINREFLGWLDRRPADRPFFAFLNFFDVHAPYVAPAPFAGRYRRRPGPLWLSHGTHAKPYTAEDRTRLSNAYDEEVAYLDSQLGALFHELGVRDLLDSTLVVITSDHGEQFGEHGFMDHGQNLYSVLLHVPLLVRLPGGERGGTRVAAPVGTLDLAATILDVVGVPQRGIGGTPLTSLWEAPGGTARPAFSYHDGFGEYMRSVVHQGWHYIEHQDGRAELYYVPDDPAELNNVIAAAPPGLIPELKGRLDVGFRGAAAGAPRLSAAR